MLNKWIAAFTQAMKRLASHKPFFVEPCKQHPDCVFVQVYRHEEHIAWKEEIPGAAAQALIKTGR